MKNKNTSHSSKKSIFGWRFKKQGGQSGGTGFNERFHGKSHNSVGPEDEERR